MRKVKRGSLRSPPGLYAVAVRPLILRRQDLIEIIRAALNPKPVEILRPDDLASLTVSFQNLTIVATDQGPPRLVRRVANRPAFLIVDFHAQHLIEEALFEIAENYPVEDPKTQLGSPGVSDPDKDKIPSIHDPPPAPPLFASIAGNSRLVFKVTKQEIPYTVEGLLAALSQLDLSVAPQAVPPAKRRRFRFKELLTSDQVDLAKLFQSVNAPLRALTQTGRFRLKGRVAAAEGATGIASELAVLGRLRQGRRPTPHPQ